MFKLRRNSKNTVPETLVEILKLAPPEAKWMKCSITFSARPGTVGLQFLDWKDSDGKYIENVEKRPPFVNLIPEKTAKTFFSTLAGVGEVEIDPLREMVGLEVTPTTGSYTPRHLTRTEYNTPEPTTPYTPRHSESENKESAETTQKTTVMKQSKENDVRPEPTERRVNPRAAK